MSYAFYGSPCTRLPYLFGPPPTWVAFHLVDDLVDLVDGAHFLQRPVADNAQAFSFLAKYLNNDVMRVGFTVVPNLWLPMSSSCRTTK